jgi:hypothetical protein
MWGYTEAPDQAELYAKNLLAHAKFSEKEKFNLLRATSVTIAGMRVNGKTRSSKEEMESSMPKLYIERVGFTNSNMYILDLQICTQLAFFLCVIQKHAITR